VIEKLQGLSGEGSTRPASSSGTGDGMNGGMGWGFGDCVGNGRGGGYRRLPPAPIATGSFLACPEPSNFTYLVVNTLCRMHP
jgi:hypothetical protein